MMQQQVEEMGASGVAAVASKVSYSGVSVAAAGWLTTSNILTIAGFVVGLLGFLVNSYFKMKHDKREEEEHQALMRKMTGQP